MHQAFKDAYANFHLKTHLLSFFEIMDPMGHKEWPNGFKEFVADKAYTNLEKNALAKRLTKQEGFAPANVDQLVFAEKIEKVGAECRRVINNFLNPNWTDDYGSGGNEEGHLLLMRTDYYKTVYIVVNARDNVQSFLRQLKNKPERDSEYRVTVESSKQDQEDEINRIARVRGANFDPIWYPSQWLTFYLFGKPCHGTDKCFSTLTSGKPEESSAEAMSKALSDLNTEAASKSIRRGSPGRKRETAAAAEAKRIQEAASMHRTVSVNHNFERSEPKYTDQQRIEKSLELLKSGDIESDEETGFSRKRKIKELSMQLLESWLPLGREVAKETD